MNTTVISTPSAASLVTVLLLFLVSSVHVLSFVAVTTTTTQVHSRLYLSNQSTDEWSGTVAIVGGGPSGLLLAHALLQKTNWNVKLFEQRSYNSEEESSMSSSRAYALGLGIRGRTAIQHAVDMELWNSVAAKGFASDRFILQAGPFSFTLRDSSEEVEPSLLLYQSDLCQVLYNELEYRWKGSPRLELNLGTMVTSIDLMQKKLFTQQGNRENLFDLVVGCDGVNSIVREVMDELCLEFRSERKSLPGMYKVVQIPNIPPQLDKSAVQLIIPQKGGVTVFLEPSIGQSCMLFAGRNESDVIFGSDNSTEVAIALESRFPKLEGLDFDDVAQQLISRPYGSASSVACNIYHLKDIVCLVGDAAHATGGVSGQGLNSALKDVEVLVGSLQRHPQSRTANALLSYSQVAVPEGKALYDLSFGDPGAGSIKQLLSVVQSVLDFVFRGRLGIGDLPLQTKLTTTLQTFVDIRRQRDAFFSKPFPDDWNKTLEQLDSVIAASLLELASVSR